MKRALQSLFDGESKALGSVVAANHLPEIILGSSWQPVSSGFPLPNGSSGYAWSHGSIDFPHRGRVLFKILGKFFCLGRDLQAPCGAFGNLNANLCLSRYDLHFYFGKHNIARGFLSREKVLLFFLKWEANPKDSS